MVLEPLTIETAEKQVKQDNAPEKRVELHLHTRMSAMDALPDTKDAVKRAIGLGPPGHCHHGPRCGPVLPGRLERGQGKV